MYQFQVRSWANTINAHPFGAIIHEIIPIVGIISIVKMIVKRIQKRSENYSVNYTVLI